MFLTSNVFYGASFSGRGACFVLFEGCNIRVGRCVCGRTSDKCYNTYSYTDEPECRQDLFKQPNPGEECRQDLLKQLKGQG